MNRFPREKKSGYYSSREEMLRYVPLAARTVLDIGCGEGHFGKLIKERQPAEVWGVEVDRNAAAKAERVLDTMICGDIEEGSLLLPGRYFDCIVFNDSLEHLRYPWVVLQGVARCLCADGSVVASVPNIRFYDQMKKLLFHEEWEYADTGIMDETHLRFFTRKSIRQMFERCGYLVLTLEGINGGRFPWKFGLLNKLLCNALDDMRYPQYACVARQGKWT